MPQSKQAKSTESQSCHSHFQVERQNTHVTAANLSSCLCSSSPPSSILLLSASCKHCLRHPLKHSRCTFFPHWARHHTASSGQHMGSKQIPQSSAIGFLTTERWGRGHGVGGGVEEAVVLGWGRTVAVAIAVAVAVAVAAGVAVAVAVAVAPRWEREELEVVGDVTTVGALRCRVGVVGGVWRCETDSK